ncbi:ABC transporter permease, partial [Verrucomicrobia bacterium]|nr:ABC transporter permease [Verrucomicrobiota bacterium]
MSFFPIVIRELLVAARKAATYRNRFWAPLVGLGICVAVISSMQGQGVVGSAQGPWLFYALSVLGLSYSLIVGVRVTADCLSFEKRDGTLGLLFLTDLKG